MRRGAALILTRSRPTYPLPARAAFKAKSAQNSEKIIPFPTSRLPTFPLMTRPRWTGPADPATAANAERESGRRVIRRLGWVGTRRRDRRWRHVIWREE